MINIIKQTAPAVFTVRMDKMRVGQVGILTEGEYKGSIVLRYYDGVVVLNKPSVCWSFPCPLLVRLLGKDESVTIEFSNEE